ncbi:MAG: hypothetical protein EA376_07960 [Phycisphaeraceae bacterium]|nr:MAG: hypothetical protein EA376_07960 [Phycisphaeraceae bacterium]
MSENQYPPNWDEDRIRRVLEHYKSQSEEEAVAEDEAAWDDVTQTIMAVPVDLAPAVRDLLSRRAS